jgi:DNA repair exonuclease SbcCD ATPase subunit
MRRVVFAGLGGLELVVAGVIVYLGLSLPRPRDVGDGFDRVETTTRKAGDQIGAMRRQVHDLRRPEMQQLADQLQRQTETVTTSLKRQRVDFQTVATLRDSLRDVAKGMDGLSEALDPARVGQLGTGLGETAKFIDETLVPVSAKSADQIDKLTADLAKDAEQLATLLRATTPDLKAAREIHDSLARFDEGLEKMLKLIELKRMDSIKEGFAGMETALDTTAGEVERLSGYTYPNVKITGRMNIGVEEKPFWPNGGKVAAGLRKATEGVRAAGKELDGIGKDLPQVRTSLEESRKVITQTRTALGQALKQQDKLEPLLRDVPTRTAKLAEDLPKLGQEFAKLLRETKRLSEVAASLRQAQKGIDATVARWPDLRRGLTRTSELLSASGEQLDRVLKNRSEYETGLTQSTELAETFARTAPFFATQFTTQLAEQERSLADLEKSLDDVGSTLPAYKSSATDLVAAGRLLAWLAAAMAALHGTFLLTENLRRKPAPTSI